MALELFDWDLYSNGRVVTYDTGEQFLERDKINYTSQEPDQWHPVVEGQRITQIAYWYYRGLTPNPAKYWNYIADANDIENPLDLSDWVGKNLLIPSFDRIKLLDT